MTRPQPRYKPGDRIGGRYQVHQVKMGGMGEVYLCLDLEEMIPLALKTFQQRYQSAALRQAFEQEVATWVALEKHPNIVRCFHMDILNNRPFMVLEWIAGEEGKGANLRGWLRRGPLELRTALNIIIDLVRGLVHAQEKQPGIVHRDLKPGNILVAQGPVAKITDFGLAQIVQAAGLEIGEDSGERAGRHSLLGQGGLVGTPAYMAPEQWRGEALDERTDINAVGCILYELLTGEWPFRVEQTSTTPQQARQWLSEMQSRHESEQPPGLPAGCPEMVGELVIDCLEKRPADRPPGLAAVLERLAELYEQRFNQSPVGHSKTGDFTAIDYNNRGLTYANLKQYAAALADFGRAIELNPGLATAFYNRGSSYQNLQQYEAALADYSRAIDLDPDDASAFYNRGNTYDTLQQYEAALADYSRAIDLDPDDATAFYNRGSTYQNLKQYEAALADYCRAIQLNPELAAACTNRGNTYKVLQQYEAALADYCRAIELDPDYATAYNNRGTTYRALQQYEAALTDYSRAIQLDPEYAEAFYNRGLTYANLQQYEAALANYRRAIDLNPEYADAYFNLGALLANTGRRRESLSYFEQAAKLGDQSAHRAIAQVRQALGEPADTSQVGPAEQAVEAFLQAGSVELMRQMVARYPFTAQADFIAAIEQVMAQQVRPEHRPYFKERLGWLRQIAQEKNQ